MNQCEDREEGVPPSKTTLCEEHESQTKAQRPKMEMPVKLQLLGTLEDLGDVELERFQWFLQDQELLDGFQAIKKSKMESANRLRTVDLMVETYTSENVMQVAELVLKKIKEYGGKRSPADPEDPSARAAAAAVDQGGAWWSPMVDTRSEEVFLSTHNRHKHHKHKTQTV
ncbi:NACHT, LRR and PYD domains-containing protein 3-like protein [Lates japonicus]|uniref:NACHT, LRR and PYD domains-containing protein 3-like protein n=1 Tax=Lates japonicus TaxID=270547 RepID=A0AAD3M3R0_LATJO|nr:NACHT, LRR and PYD domains-containing protein 3-like protein [Lates japonicus]